MKATCSNCPFGVEFVDSSGKKTGTRECRHGRVLGSPVATHNEPGWWCSEHPLAPGQRDKLAAMAMQGMVPAASDDWIEPEILAQNAYEIADAMLEFRKRGDDR